MSVGATQAGLRLVGKLEKPGGFGLPLMEANRRYLGSDWQAQVGDPETWQPVKADVIVGTPPCAAFSGMSVGTPKHGVHSEINNCMRDLINYAVTVKPAAVIMESVAQAYSQGITLMRELAETLSTGTGLPYRTTHVLQNNWTLGGATKRRRYFLVLTPVPFGVEFEPVEQRATLNDAIGDLRDQPLGWEARPYEMRPTWWSAYWRSHDNTVDGHALPINGQAYQARIADLVAKVPWHVGDTEIEVLKRYYETEGELPESWRYDGRGSRSGLNHLTRDKQLIEKNFEAGGFSRPRHWPWYEPGRVINGAGPFMIWHPNNRFATHREVARLMGFPDDYLIEPLRDNPALGAYWGKGTSVAPAKWICEWVKRSLDGEPGSLVGERQEDGSRLIDVSKLSRSRETMNVELPA
jgi:site-specific DNA-cytosine methylase